MENKNMCAIIGENPDELEFGYDEEYYLCASMKYRLVEAMQEVIAQGCASFATTVDQGAAMWGAEACMAIKQLGGGVTLTAAPNSEDQADRWHPERRERYFDVLENADEIVDPFGDCHGIEYIFGHCDLIIVLGNAALPRLAEIIDRARVLGIEVKVA